MSASSSSSDAVAGNGGGGGKGSSGGIQGKKTNVCLICGIYTNLSINIFEPRNGPNIREVIYQKYNFKAERSENEEKYICFSCNNWLINWYSLQHLSESRNYESTPSSSRSQPENRNKRSKNGRSHPHSPAGSCRDKENLEQDNQVTSTVKTPEKQHPSPKRKARRTIRGILKESSQQDNLTNSSNILVKPFESHLIRMLENQGTSVIKEKSIPFGDLISSTFTEGKSSYNVEKKSTAEKSNRNEIVLSFNSAISEVVDVLPSLRTLCHNKNQPELISPSQLGENFLRSHRLSTALSISVIKPVKTEQDHNQADN